MKKLLTLTTLICLAMICSCQKQDSTAAGFAQRKAELDAREKALDERDKALAEREKALAEKATTKIPADHSQLEAERDKKIQQLPPEVQSGIPDPAHVKAETDARMQELLDQRQQMLEQYQKGRISRALAYPAAKSPAAAAAPK
jgi:hypothetical protein